MEDIVKQGMLYDFYGELLTEHQRSVYGDFVIDNFSISEIAEEYGITRQAASDLVKRISRILNAYEEKLKLVEKFSKIKRQIEMNPNLSQIEKEELLKEL